MSLWWNSPPPPVKYKGLYNQGATCYLNSVLQVLVMTDDFKEAVERYPGTEHIDVQLRNLFGELRNQTAYTFDITKKLDIRQVYKQQDAAEYFEKILNLTSKEASQIFHGELTHRTVCLGCDTHSDADGQFWNLPLTLVDSNNDSSSEYRSEYSVLNGIKEYFKVSTFSEGNQMYCEKCDEKRDATIQFVMKHHPEVLMLLLKRFELNYYTMTYIKINHKVLIPYTLQIPENQTYELYAVVDHFGDLRHGHYSACIKSQEEERWFQFNDSCVRQLDFQPFQSDNFESSDSAYLLFYRKKSAPAADTQTPKEIREESVPGGCSPTTSDVDEVMVNEGEEGKERETDIPVHDNDRVSVNSEEEVKLPVPRCNVEELENSYRPMQGNHEENNESNDSLLQPQVREKDEVKTAPVFEEVSGRTVEGEENGGVPVSDENQDHDEGEKQDKVKKKRQQGHISTSPFDVTSKQGDINTCVTPKYLQEVCVDDQIRNEGNIMKGKRDKDKDKKREMREKGQHEDNEGKRKVQQSMKVDPVEKQQDEKDPKSYREIKQGGEKKVREDSETASKVKSGANKGESRSETPLPKIHGDERVDKETRNKVKDSQVSNQGRSSWYERREQNIQGSKKQNRGDKQSYQVIDERSSDDSRQKKAHPKHVDVSVVETHTKRSHSERTQDRNRSPHGKTGAVVRSRSLPEGQREDGKKERQVTSDKGRKQEVEKQHSKEEHKKGTQSGIQKEQEPEEITLETPTRTKKRKGNFTKLFSWLSLQPKAKKAKITPETPETETPETPETETPETPETETPETPETPETETPEQAAVVKHKRKNRLLSLTRKQSKEKEKGVKPNLFFGCLSKNHTSESD